MGRKGATQSIAAVLLAFLRERSWKQSELAREVGLERKALVRILDDLQLADFRIDREEEHPHVIWTVPNAWFPGAVAFKSGDVSDLARVLQRAPASRQRDRLLQSVLAQSTGFRPGHGGALITRTLSAEEEGTLARLQESAEMRHPLRVRYFTLSRGLIGSRHLSVQRILLERGRFIAVCHRDQSLKWFRIDGILNAELDAGVQFLPVSDEDIEKVLRESVDGYHSGRPAVRCSFIVRRDDARWIQSQLPLACETEEGSSGTVFSATTSGLLPLARFIVGLGSAAQATTPELAALVRELALGALHDRTDPE